MSPPGRSQALIPSALEAALAQCELHARVLRQDLQTLPRGFDVAAAAALDEGQRMLLDQAAYRYMKLQDALGEKVLPALLALTLDPLPPEAPFAQKLQRLERLGVVSSAAAWKLLREARNSLAHDYPDYPEVQAAVLTGFLAAAAALLDEWDRARRFAAHWVAEGPSAA